MWDFCICTRRRLFRRSSPQDWHKVVQRRAVIRSELCSVIKSKDFISSRKKKRKVRESWTKGEWKKKSILFSKIKLHRTKERQSTLMLYVHFMSHNKKGLGFDFWTGQGLYVWHVLPMSVKHPLKKIFYMSGYRLINITHVFLNSLFILMPASTKGTLTETMEMTRTAEDHVLYLFKQMFIFSSTMH